MSLIQVLTGSFGGGTPPPSNPSMVVAGAGTTIVNGTYLAKATPHNGKLWYVLEGHTIVDPADGYSLFWDSGGPQWLIFDDGGTAAYQSTDDVATPNLATTWLQASPGSSYGLLPVPTVTQAP